MKVEKEQNIIALRAPVDATAHPMLAIYTNGFPEVNPDSHAILVQQVDRNHIFNMSPRDQELRGRPTMFSLIHDGFVTSLTLWPIPDKDYEAVFEFNPPRRKL